jgi:AraC-like DNA-binding protein
MRCPPASAVTHRLPGPTDVLLGAHIEAQEHSVPEAREADAAGLDCATALVLAAAVGPNLATLGAARPALEAARLSHGRGYTRDHLADPALGPEAPAEALHLSRSVIYRLFEPLGGVAGYVSDQRLALAWRRLQAPTGREGIAQVAADCGFTSATHFARLFKAAYGVTPKKARQVAPPRRDTALLLRREGLEVWSDGLG